MLSSFRDNERLDGWFKSEYERRNFIKHKKSITTAVVCYEFRRL